MDAEINSILEKFNFDTTRLMDILWSIQDTHQHIPNEAVTIIADKLNLSPNTINETISFYHFFQSKPVGKYVIYLNNSITAQMQGYQEVKDALIKETSCNIGETDKDGLIGIFETSCMGMCDQEPAALINGTVFTNLTADKIKDIVSNLKAGKDVTELISKFGDGSNSSDLIKAMVCNNIQEKGPVIFDDDYKKGASVEKALKMSPDDVIIEIQKSILRGRGGAGFPTGKKWEFCKKAHGKKHYVVCNADEGEPGTFKDRVILTEKPFLLFEGIIINGYAIGSDEGIIYLRGEYRYLQNYLEAQLEEFRKSNLLGKNILGKNGFDFDIRIQIGAGAYICGEESALISSMEGRRGEPKNRPPFPVAVGYMSLPTCVNNVESLCAASQIILNGSDWFKNLGTAASTGTRLLSISGDCENPGVYECPFGITIGQLLKKAGAIKPKAIQVGGPSGTCIPATQSSRQISFEDLPTGGSFIIIGEDRDLLNIVNDFMDFFIEESCGVCVPCRAGNVALKNHLQKVIDGKARQKDIDELIEWGKLVKSSSRCGLGQTSPNPILNTIEFFKDEYQSKLKQEKDDLFYDFDLTAAVTESCEFVGRDPHFELEKD